MVEARLAPKLLDCAPVKAQNAASWKTGGYCGGLQTVIEAGAIAWNLRRVGWSLGAWGEMS
jgi:hypothetical protein